jgi:hypothetical protein
LAPEILQARLLLREIVEEPQVQIMHGQVAAVEVFLE